MVRLCLPMVWGAASRARVDAVDDPFFVTAPDQEQIDAQNVLDDLLMVEKMAGSKDAQDRPYAVLLVSPQGDRVFAAVASGDVDHAANVAVITPGMGSNVRESLGYYVKRGDNVRAVAYGSLKVDPSATATVAWMGYDTPDGLLEASNTDRARAGAVSLASFADGLDASRTAEGWPVHLTFLAHSYGSTTGCLAATLTAPGTIDDLVLTGSPGTGVQDVSVLNVPAGHVFNSAADMRMNDDGFIEQDGAVNIFTKMTKLEHFVEDVGCFVEGPACDPAAGVGVGFGQPATDMEGVTQLSGVVGVPAPVDGVEGWPVARLHRGYLDYADEENLVASGSLTDITKVIVGQYP